MRVKGISIIGLGYVGLPLAVFLAEKGYRVFGVDKDESKINSLLEGKVYLYEEGLAERLVYHLRRKSLNFTTDYSTAVKYSDITFITVGTPTLKDGAQDLSQIISSLTPIARLLREKEDYHLIVVKSTILPEYSRKVLIPHIETVSGKKVGSEIGFVYNPEFIREGKALYDFNNPSKIIIGEYDQKSGDYLASLYVKIYGENAPIIRTTLENAELCKYANNIYLALKISYINSIARICELIPNTDVEVIRQIIGLDPRINSSYMEAGLGFGGSCLPKDLRAMIKYAMERGYLPELFNAIIHVNEMQALWPITYLKNIYKQLKNKVISILGLTFKENTDDVRESQSIPIIKELLNCGAIVKVYDPLGMENFRRLFPFLNKNVIFSKDPLDCIKDADAVIIATKWSQFLSLSPKDFRRYMRNPLVIDGRRLYSPEDFRDTGVIYIRVGTYPSNPNIDLEM